MYERKEVIHPDDIPPLSKEEEHNLHEALFGERSGDEPSYELIKGVLTKVPKSGSRPTEGASSSGEGRTAESGSSSSSTKPPVKKVGHVKLLRKRDRKTLSEQMAASEAKVDRSVPPAVPDADATTEAA